MPRALVIFCVYIFALLEMIYISFDDRLPKHKDYYYAQHPPALGSNPRHNIYAFLIYSFAKLDCEMNEEEAGFGPFENNIRSMSQKRENNDRNCLFFRPLFLYFRLFNTVDSN